MFLFLQLALCSLALLASSITGVSGNAAACGSLEVNQTAPSNGIVANDSSVLELSGANVSLTCVCTGDSSNPVSWYNSGGDVVGNGGMLEVASLDGNATYECRESDPLFHLVNLVAVDISVSPPTQLISVSDGAVFTCVDAPTGAGTFTYQWQLNGTDISDGTDFSGTATSELTIQSAQMSDSGTYTCVATLNGVMQSATGELTVQADPPQVTVQPVGQTNIAPGSEVSFNVTATGTAPLSYQWQKGDMNLTDGGSITGATTATLTITGVMESDEGGYRCVVTNIAGMKTSNTANLTVVDQPPQVTVHPVDETDIAPGSNVSFSVTATGTAPLSYQWQKDGVDLTDGDRITGATTATLTITGVMESDEGGYRCVVSNSLGMDTSNNATLTVVDPPEITEDPMDVNATFGENANFTCTASGSVPLMFSWTATATVSPLPSATEVDNGNGSFTSTLELAMVDTGYRGDYTCTVTNAGGTEMSDPATLTVTLSALSVGTLEDVHAAQGSNATFFCDATGDGVLSYAWVMDGAALAGAEDSAYLVLTDVSTENVGTYSCNVTNEDEVTVTSNSAMLTLLVIYPIANQSIGHCGNTTFFCNASSGLNDQLTYQWDRPGFVITSKVTGRKTDTLVFTNVDPREAGVYRCTVTQKFGLENVTVSTRASLETKGPTAITPLPRPTVIRNVGEDLELNITVMNEPKTPVDLIIDWFKDSELLWNNSRITVITYPEVDNVARSSLTIRSLVSADAGNYSVVASCSGTNYYGVFEDSTTVIITFAPNVKFDGEKRVQVNGNLTITCIADSVPPPSSVELFDAQNGTVLASYPAMGTNTSTEVRLDYLFEPTELGQPMFTCNATNDIGTGTASVVITVQDVPDAVDPSSITVSNVSLRRVKVTWSVPVYNNAPITRYELLFCEMSESIAPCQDSVLVDAPATSYEYDDLDANEMYSLTITAFNEVGSSPETPVTFNSPTSADGQVVGFSVDYTSDSGFFLSWSLPQLAVHNDVSVWGFNLEYTSDSGMEGSIVIPYPSKSAKNEEFTGAVTMLTDASQPYSLSLVVNYSNPILLSDVALLDGQSLLMMGAIPPGTPDMTVPSDAVSGEASISWPAFAVDPMEYVIKSSFVSRVTRRKKRQSQPRDETTPGTSFTLRNLNPYSTYTVSVFARLLASDGTTTLDVLAAVPSTFETAEGVPNAPLNLANPNDDGMQYTFLLLTWDSPTEPNGIIISYKVSYSMNQDTVKSVTISQADFPSANNPYRLEGLVANTEYTISVVASTTAGEGPASAEQLTAMTNFGVVMPGIDTTQGSDPGTSNLLITFDEAYGPISHYVVIVLTTNLEPGDLGDPIPTNSESYYIALSGAATAGTTSVMIGTEETESFKGVSYSNQKLEGGIFYAAVRAYSEVDETVQSTSISIELAVKGAAGISSGIAVVIAVSVLAVILLIIFIILVIVVVLTRGSQSNRRKSFVLRDGRGNRGEVELKRRTRIISPTLNVIEPDVFTSAGQPTLLLCEASGTPVPEVEWSKDGEKLVMDEKKYLMMTDHSLQIMDTDLSDEGTYLVTATNSSGTAKMEVKVTVIRPMPPEPDEEHPPIPVGDFTEKTAILRADDAAGLEDEYADVELEWNVTSYASKVAVNRNKNRYINIIPYDHSRVVLELQDLAPGSDYINASFIDGYNNRNGYIATQGPIPSTFADLWRLIWDFDIPTIVMVTNLQEDDKVKCHQYWPTYGATTYGHLKVSLKEVENIAEYSIRTFTVQPISGQNRSAMPIREIKQFHFLVWPDHGVPQYATALLHFRKRVHTYHQLISRGPMLVHCSAGVGRTGTFISIDSILQQIEAEGVVDIFNFVRRMRFRRNYMVQTASQYVFIYDAILEAIMCGNTSIPPPLLREKLAELQEVDKDTGKTHLLLQFEKLNVSSPKDSEMDCTIAEMHDNQKKNRYHKHLPSDEWRVVLGDEKDESDYICASFLDGYRHRDAFIITQAPLPDTVKDFWNMIWEQKSAAIIMLCQLEENGESACAVYWPSETGQPMVFGTYQVEKTSEDRDEGDYIIRKFKVSSVDKPQDSRVITQFHYTKWSADKLPESPKLIIELIDEVQRVQRKSGNGPITVHCSNGLGRTGSLCAIYSVLERMKTEQMVDVFQTVKTLRIQRVGLVETVEQYTFVYATVLEFLSGFEQYQNFK